VDWDSPSGYGPMISANRPLRTRMMWWCGEGQIKAAPYPIIGFFILLYFEILSRIPVITFISFFLLFIRQ
jgi:hypothetical protein